jgi:integrase
MADSERGRWEAWAHGRCWVTPSGERTYYIRARLGVSADGKPRRIEVNTRRHKLHEAVAEWERFARNPGAYSPAGTAPREPLHLDRALSEAFLAWSRDVKGNSEKHRKEQRRILAWWAERLPGVDLRCARFEDHIRPALEGKPPSTYRAHAAIILGLYRWLRLERDLDLTEDPVHGRFYLPDATPEQWRRVKAVPREHFEKALEHLTGIYRDALILQAGTGAHVSEVWRFVQTGSVEPLPRNAMQDGSVGLVVFPLTKGKDVLRVRADERTLAAAEKLLEYGRAAAGNAKRRAFSKERYVDAVKSACDAAGVPVFKPGQMRHSVATLAVNAGADLAAVSAFLGHKSPKTTRRFYATHGAVAKVPTLNAPGAASIAPGTRASNR